MLYKNNMPKWIMFYLDFMKLKLKTNFNKSFYANKKNSSKTMEYGNQDYIKTKVNKKPVNMNKMKNLRFNSIKGSRQNTMNKKI